MKNILKWSKHFLQIGNRDAEWNIFLFVSLQPRGLYRVKLLMLLQEGTCKLQKKKQPPNQNNTKQKTKTEKKEQMKNNLTWRITSILRRSVII